MKKTIITFAIGLIVGISATVGAVALYSAKDISFEPSDSSWNVTNVEAAINSLSNDYSDGKYSFVANLMGYTSAGTSYVSIVDTSSSIHDAAGYLVNNANINVNDKYAEYNNGIITLKKDGTIRLCVYVKAHSSSSNLSYGRLYYNSTLIYSANANEIVRCDDIEVTVGDTLNFQFASGATHAQASATYFYIN